MALTHQSVVRRWSTGPCVWALTVAGLLIVAAAIAVVATAGDRKAPSRSSMIGSGVSVTDHRDVAPFTSIELAGANIVKIHVGAPLSVAVTGDDNLVGQITTDVASGRLVIDNTASFTTEAPMHVAVSVPSLDGVELSGAGTITAEGITNAEFTAELPGDGTMVASGTVDRVTAMLAGAGTLDLHDLLATDGTSHLEGTGTIRVHVTSTLDATLSGTGTIRYQGDPAVTIRNTGTGTVVPE